MHHNTFPFNIKKIVFFLIMNILDDHVFVNFTSESESEKNCSIFQNKNILDIQEAL